jgi:hypothetical protein
MNEEEVVGWRKLSQMLQMLLPLLRRRRLTFLKSEQQEKV